MKIISLCDHMMSLSYFLLPKSYLSFHLFSPPGPLCPLQPFLLFCHLRVLLSLLLFSCHSVQSSVANLFFASLSLWYVCIWGRWLMDWVMFRETDCNTQKMQDVSGSLFFRIFYFNTEYQNMQKLKSNIHKIWSLYISSTLSLYPARPSWSIFI